MPDSSDDLVVKVEAMRNKNKPVPKVLFPEDKEEKEPLEQIVQPPSKKQDISKELYPPIENKHINGQEEKESEENPYPCLLYTSPSPRDQRGSRMPSSA